MFTVVAFAFVAIVVVSLFGLGSMALAMFAIDILRVRESKYKLD